MNHINNYQKYLSISSHITFQKDFPSISARINQSKLATTTAVSYLFEQYQRKDFMDSHPDIQQATFYKKPKSKYKIYRKDDRHTTIASIPNIKIKAAIKHSNPLNQTMKTPNLKRILKIKQRHHKNNIYELTTTPNKPTANTTASFRQTFITTQTQSPAKNTQQFKRQCDGIMLDCSGLHSNIMTQHNKDRKTIELPRQFRTKYYDDKDAKVLGGDYLKEALKKKERERVLYEGKCISKMGTSFAYNTQCLMRKMFALTNKPTVPLIEQENLHKRKTVLNNIEKVDKVLLKNIRANQHCHNILSEYNKRSITEY